MTMALKLAGGILTVGASGLLGLKVAESYRARERELAAWITALNALQTEISYGHTRLGQALRRAGGAFGGAFGSAPAQVMECAAQLLDEGGLEGPGECIAVALGSLGHGIPGDAVDAIVALGHRLGASDAADQARHIGLAIRRLEGARDRAEDAAARNSRVWSSVGFLVGGMVTIALL